MMLPVYIRLYTLLVFKLETTNAHDFNVTCGKREHELLLMYYTVIRSPYRLQSLKNLPLGVELLTTGYK